MATYEEQICELIRANGWEGQLSVVDIEPEGGPQKVRVKLSENHPVAPGESVNDYIDGIHPLEQVQQECLRALRTGRPGI